MKPWIFVSILLTLITYIPSLKNVFKYSEPVKNKFEAESPVNTTKVDQKTKQISSENEKTK